MAKGPFMEFIRVDFSLSAANIYTEEEVATPSSRTETMAMLIHSIEMYPTIQADTTPTNNDSINLHVSKTSKAAYGYISDPDILAIFGVTTHLNAVFNGFTYRGSQIQKFDPPILYPKASLFFAAASLGFAQAAAVKCRIGYTLEKVSREDFISALVE